MKILLINYRYFVSGGPERYLFKLKNLLESHGHEIVPFSIAYDQNEPTEYAEYFAEPLGDPSQVYFRDHQGGGATSTLRTLERSFYSPHVYERLERLIDAVQPDYAYVLHYLRKLSPSVLKCLDDKAVPFSVFLADFGMICPNAHLLRDSEPCELCVGGALRNSVRYACVQDSRPASAVNYAATRYHQARGYYDLIPSFVAPSRFMRTMMLKGGFEPERVDVVPMFVPAAKAPAEPQRGSPVIAYAGRLDHTKGTHTLLEAVRMLNDREDVPPFIVKVAGTGEDGYVKRMAELKAEWSLTNVEFEGWQPLERITELLRSALCAVVPSLWYENTPNSALEPMAQGVPIVASRHGCFPEFVEDEANGLLFEPGNAAELADRLERLLQDPDLARAKGRAALEFVQGEHSAAHHYKLLMDNFDRVRGKSRGGARV